MGKQEEKNRQDKERLRIEEEIRRRREAECERLQEQQRKNQERIEKGEKGRPIDTRPDED